jgi:hypothetical protein
MPGIFSNFFVFSRHPEHGQSRSSPQEDRSHRNVWSVPGPWNRPAAEAGLHLGPKTSLERVRGLDDCRRALTINFLDYFFTLEHQQMVS